MFPSYSTYNVNKRGPIHGKLKQRIIDDFRVGVFLEIFFTTNNDGRQLEDLFL